MFFFEGMIEHPLVVPAIGVTKDEYFHLRQGVRYVFDPRVEITIILIKEKI